MTPRSAHLACLILVALGCRTVEDAPASRPDRAAVAQGTDVDHRAWRETIDRFGDLIPEETVVTEPDGVVRLERVSTAVPWPRGLAWVDGELVVLARGRHRRSGGIDLSIPDRAGTLFAIDPDVHEEVREGELASAAVRDNARTLALPSESIFRLYDGSVAPSEDRWMDRPYCTLIWDEVSRNLFICGYSGVDLPGAKFRKNATDSIHRFDLRTQRWYSVELHDADVVPVEELSWVVPNQYYPHHDPATNPAPHGWVNGPDSGCVAGEYLYVAGKDNHLVAQYDLAGVRRDPEAGPPESRPVLGPHVTLSTPMGARNAELLGPSAVVAREGWLYVGYRSSSTVVRFELDESGDLVAPDRAELIAVFQPYDPEIRRSANLIDLAFDSAGDLYVSCADAGRVWRVGQPDPARPFYGDDKSERPTSAPPYLDMAELTGQRTNVGNIQFDDQDRLYVCTGNYDTDSTKLAGVIYRAVRTSTGPEGTPGPAAD